MKQYKDDDVVGLICDGMTILIINEQYEYEVIMVEEDEYERLKAVLRE